MEAKGRLWRKSHMPLIPYFLGEGGGQGGEVENKRPVWGVLTASPVSAKHLWTWASSFRGVGGGAGGKGGRGLRSRETGNFRKNL